MQKAPVPIVDSLMKHHWTTTQSCKFRQKQHINLLELEMLRAEIKARVNTGGDRCRCINLCDSRVVVGAFAKGRSSSKSLNHGLRSCLPWLIAGDLQLVNLCVATDKNPADFPSRFKDFPPSEFASNDPSLDSAVLQGVQVRRSTAVQDLKVDPVRSGSCCSPESSPALDTSPSKVETKSPPAADDARAPLPYAMTRKCSPSERFLQERPDCLKC